MPNINTPHDEHEIYCGLGQESAHSGDVRRCKHERLQVNVGFLGSAFGIWDDLSPVFNPIRYHRAKKALELEMK